MTTPGVITDYVSPEDLDAWIVTWDSIEAGSLPISRLPSVVARRDEANVFTQNQTINARVISNEVQIGGGVVLVASGNGSNHISGGNSNNGSGILNFAGLWLTSGSSNSGDTPIERDSEGCAIIYSSASKSSRGDWKMRNLNANGTVTVGTPVAGLAPVISQSSNAFRVTFDTAQTTQGIQVVGTNGTTYWTVGSMLQSGSQYVQLDGTSAGSGQGRLNLGGGYLHVEGGPGSTALRSFGTLNLSPAALGGSGVVQVNGNLTANGNIVQSGLTLSSTSAVTNFTHSATGYRYEFDFNNPGMGGRVNFYQNATLLLTLSARSDQQNISFRRNGATQPFIGIGSQDAHDMSGLFYVPNVGVKVYATNGYAFVDPMIRFGGDSASFPAWKRSGTTIQARLADDSGFAPITAATGSQLANLIFDSVDNNRIRSSVDNVPIRIVPNSLYGLGIAVGSYSLLPNDNNYTLGNGNNNFLALYMGPFANGARVYSGAKHLRLEGYESSLSAWQESVRAEASPSGALFSVLGATPIGRQTLPAAATDAATTQTLANAIRTLLINFGFAN